MHGALHGALHGASLLPWGINSRGLCALAHGVALNRSMQSMTLWGNRFDSAACLAWTPALDRLELDFCTQEVDGTFIPVMA